MIDFEKIGTTYFDIIESQLIIIASISELPDELYDELQEEKIRVISNAMLVIQAVQKSLLIWKQK
jgi:hypothetical protein